jgi:hypothetical protein
MEKNVETYFVINKSPLKRAAIYDVCISIIHHSKEWCYSDMLLIKDLYA